MRKLRFIPAAAVLLLLSGCTSLVEGDYRIVTDHTDSVISQETTASIYEIHSFAGLKNAVQSLVNSAAEQGIIRAVEYSGSVLEDISRVCLDVTRESPIGSYAVEYITHTVTRILTYDEIDLHISYKMSGEEIAMLRVIPTVSDYFQMIDTALESGSPQLISQLVTLSVNEQTIKNRVEDYYRSHPDKLLYKPSVSVSFYPSADYVQKIIVLDFQYYSTEDQRRSDLSSLLELAAACVEDVSTYSDTAEKALHLCRLLSDHTSVQSKGRTAYDVLMLHSGSSEAFAMAYQLLCNLADIPCQVICGQLDGISHYWNIIRIDDAYYHVDCSEYTNSEDSSCYLMNDSMMKDRYWWETGSYPACDGPLYREQSVSSTGQDVEDSGSVQNSSVFEQ